MLQFRKYKSAAPATLVVVAVFLITAPATAQEVYLGAFGQGAFGQFRNVDPLDGSLDTGVFGALAGGEIRRGQWLFGIEGDLGGAIGSSRETLSVDIGGFPLVGVVEARKRAEGSVRLRVGRAFGRLTPYLTGGYSAALFELDTAVSFLGATARDSSSELYHGFTGGGGVAIDLPGGWAVRPEARYTRYFERSEVGFREFSGRVSLIWRFPAAK